jgi:hypothetical protein
MSLSPRDVVVTILLATVIMAATIVGVGVYADRVSAPEPTAPTAAVAPIAPPPPAISRQLIGQEQGVYQVYDLAVYEPDIGLYCHYIIHRAWGGSWAMSPRTTTGGSGIYCTRAP